jgi:hypothetical protein
MPSIGTVLGSVPMKEERPGLQVRFTLSSRTALGHLQVHLYGCSYYIVLNCNLRETPGLTARKTGKQTIVRGVGLFRPRHQERLVQEPAKSCVSKLCTYDSLYLDSKTLSK